MKSKLGDDEAMDRMEVWGGWRRGIAYKVRPMSG
jgi:hypothetical protein